MKHVLLNNIDHKDLRISTRQSAVFGDNVNFGLIVPSELKTAQNFYPIFIQKDTHTGKFFFSVLFGFQEGENLFLDDAGWNAEYIPLSILRQPFLIGQQAYVQDGVNKVERVINLDLESPRLNTADGERVFDAAGAPTAYLNTVANMLESLHTGLLEADQLLERLLAYDLLEPLTLKVTFNEYKQYELANMYTINQDVLESLSDDKVLELFRSGSLEKIYCILHSQARVSTLIRLKNQQDAL